MADKEYSKKYKTYSAKRRAELHKLFQSMAHRRNTYSMRAYDDSDDKDETPNIFNEVKDKFDSFHNDYEHFGVGVEFLEKEINSYGEVNDKKIKRLIEDLENWVPILQDTLSNLSGALDTYKKKLIIEKIKDED